MNCNLFRRGVSAVLPPAASVAQHALLLVTSRRSFSAGTHIDPTNTAMARLVDISDKSVTKRTATAVSRIWLPPVVMQEIRASTDTEVITQKKAGYAHYHRTVAEIGTAKGPVLAAAVIAGTMAVKNTPQLIPFCHPLPIERCNISFSWSSRNPETDVAVGGCPSSSSSVLSSSSPADDSDSADSGAPDARSDNDSATTTTGGAVLCVSCEVGTTHRTGVEMEALTGATVAALCVYDMLKGVPQAQATGMRLLGAEVQQKRGGKQDICKDASSAMD